MIRFIPSGADSVEELDDPDDELDEDSDEITAFDNFALLTGAGLFVFAMKKITYFIQNLE